MFCETSSMAHQLSADRNEKKKPIAWTQFEEWNKQQDCNWRIRGTQKLEFAFPFIPLKGFLEDDPPKNGKKSSCFSSHLNLIKLIFAIKDERNKFSKRIHPFFICLPQLSLKHPFCICLPQPSLVIPSEYFDWPKEDACREGVKNSIEIKCLRLDRPLSLKIAVCRLSRTQFNLNFVSLYFSFDD